jgi:hypothetical protein
MLIFRRGYFVPPLLWLFHFFFAPGVYVPLSLFLWLQLCTVHID